MNLQERNRLYYLAHREAILVKRKERYWADPTYQREYSRTHPSYDSRFIGYVESWKKRNPEKHRAHQFVLGALRSGKLKKQPCEKCGAKGHAHHDDYSKPLAIRWLCRKHHAAFHRRVN